MQFHEFNNAFVNAKRQIQRQGFAAVAAAAEQLRALLPQLESDEDRRVAGDLIDKLPRYAVPPAPRSALMVEALEVERTAFQATGTDEERIALMAAARRKIFEIADRASADEAAGIRGLTRVLEHLEDNLSDPHWPFDEPQDVDGGK